MKKAILTKIKDLRYEGQHPNGIDEGYIQRGIVYIWQEVVEKDYEVLSFKSTNNHPSGAERISNLRSNNLFSWEDDNVGDCTLESMLESLTKGTNTIYSVKRLSDGEIFTIGDKFKLLDFSTGLYTISKFTISNNLIIIGNKEYGGSSILKHIEKVKQPLFTTEDNVDIFDLDKDKFYWVRFKDPNFYNHLWKLETLDHRLSFVYEPKIEKYFSTKEKAEEYVLMNKPCLSFKDIEVYFDYNYDKKQILKFIKDKLEL